MGVVAALTIPSLIVKNQEKETVIRLKKVYSTLNNALQLAQVDYGDIETWNWKGEYDPQSSLEAAYKLTKNLNVIKNCTMGQGCFKNAQTHTIGGEPENNFDTDTRFAKIMLADGASFALGARGTNCALVNLADNTKINYCADAIIDINGPKLPNTYGKDTFVFLVSKQGIIPRGMPNMSNMTGWNISKCHTTGGNCGAWVLYKENMDYLKGEVSWN